MIKIKNKNKQDNIGWTEGFGTLAGAIGVALVIFIIGIPRYRKEAPVGSPYTKVAQVFVAAIKKRQVKETHQSIYEKIDHDGQRRVRLMARTHQFRYESIKIGSYYHFTFGLSQIANILVS